MAALVSPGSLYHKIMLKLAEERPADKPILTMTLLIEAAALKTLQAAEKEPVRTPLARIKMAHSAIFSEECPFDIAQTMLTVKNLLAVVTLDLEHKKGDWAKTKINLSIKDSDGESVNCFTYQGNSSDYKAWLDSEGHSISCKA